MIHFKITSNHKKQDIMMYFFEIKEIIKTLNFKYRCKLVFKEILKIIKKNNIFYIKISYIMMNLLKKKLQKLWD